MDPLVHRRHRPEPPSPDQHPRHTRKDRCRVYNHCRWVGDLVGDKHVLDRAFEMARLNDALLLVAGFDPVTARDRPSMRRRAAATPRPICE